MASITDKISRVSTGAGRPNSAVVQSTRTVGGTSLSCDDLTNWTTDDVSYLAVYTVDTAGKIIPGSQVDFKGIVTGNTINNLVVTGGTDRSINVGDIVIAVPTAQYAKDLGDHILTSHNQDGTLKNKIATLGKIHGGSTEGVLTTDASGNVSSTPKLPADKLDSASFTTTVDANGWEVNSLGAYTIYKKSFSFSGVSVPSGAGSGALAVSINLPAGATFSDNDVIGESSSCGTAEVYLRRLDNLSSGTRRLFAVNTTGIARTISGSYTLTLMKRA